MSRRGLFSSPARTFQAAVSGCRAVGWYFQLTQLSQQSIPILSLFKTEEVNQKLFKQTSIKFSIAPRLFGTKDEKISRQPLPLIAIKPIHLGHIVDQKKNHEYRKYRPITIGQALSFGSTTNGRQLRKPNLEEVNPTESHGVIQQS